MENTQSSSVLTSKDSQYYIKQLKIEDIEKIRAIPNSMPKVLLVDVDGYELQVMRGAKVFIKRNRPLIVFEYNGVSKKYFRSVDIGTF